MRRSSPASARASSTPSARPTRTRWCSRSPTRSPSACSRKGLDAGTAYEILSIDIADIDVGDNIGANLEALQAEADTRVARAKAEERRAFAVAKEQEMMAHVQENRAKVVQAEAEIPMAIAEAFRKGNLGIVDYYNLRNVQADTEMRNSIAGTSNAAAAGAGGRHG